MSMDPDGHDIFLSCVSPEFHDGGAPEFDSYRVGLAKVLEKARFHVAHQEAFPVSGGGLLKKLEDLVKGSKAVVHLVGDMLGSCPKPDEVTRLWSRIPDFLLTRPELQAAVKGCDTLSYTQWEALLAVHFDVPCFIFRATEDAPRARKPDAGSSDANLQELHFSRVRATGLDRGTFSSLQELKEMLLVSLHSYSIVKKLHVRPNLEPAYGGELPGRQEMVGAMVGKITQARQRLLLGYRGLGGVGKTRLVTEIGHALLALGKVVLFVKSASSEPWSGVFQKLALTVGLHGEEELYEWMENPENRDWVLILDGVDRLETMVGVRNFAERFPQGHILVTTRMRPFMEGFAMETLGPLDDTGADALMMGLFRSHGLEWPGKHSFSERSRLYLELGHLPLACEQAAAYLCEHFLVTIPEYLEKFSDRSENQLRALFAAVPEERGGQDAGDFLVHDMPMARTWWVNFEAMQVPGARTLLRLFSFMSDDPIPDDLLKVEAVEIAFVLACESDPFESGRACDGDKADLAGAYQELLRYGFITPSSSSGDFWIHRLVLYFTRIELEASRDASFWPEAFKFLFSLGGGGSGDADSFHHHRERLMVYPVRFLSAYFFAKEIGERIAEVQAKLDPHVFSILDAMERYRSRNVQMERLLQGEKLSLAFLAGSAHRRAQEEDLESCKLLTQLELEGDVSNLERVLCWTRLTDCLFWQQDLQGCLVALQEGRRLLDSIAEDAPGRVEVEFDFLITRGWPQRWCGDCDGAIHTFERALELVIRHGMADASRADALSGLASSLDYAGRYEEARRYHREAMGNLAEADAQGIAFVKYMAGWIELRVGNRAQGIRWCEEALEIGERNGYYTVVEEASWILAVGRGLEERWQDGLTLLERLKDVVYGLSDEWIAMLTGVFLYRSGKRSQAVKIFEVTIQKLDETLQKSDATPGFDLWDTLAFCHIGLALYGRQEHRGKAQVAYANARERCSAKGVVDIGLTCVRLLGDGVDEILGVAGAGGE